MGVPWEHLVIRRSRPAVDTEAIGTVSKEIGFAFPQEYIAFLLAHNGGSFRPWPGYAIDGCPRSEGGLLQCFFNIGTGDSLDLLGRYQVHCKRMPAELLPIGSDPGGNLICVACTGEQLGRVFFWERAYEANSDAGEVVGWQNVFKIADSFPAFLLSLQV